MPDTRREEAVRALSILAPAGVATALGNDPTTREAALAISSSLERIDEFESINLSTVSTLREIYTLLDPNSNSDRQEAFVSLRIAVSGIIESMKKLAGVGAPQYDDLKIYLSLLARNCDEHLEQLSLHLEKLDRDMELINDRARDAAHKLSKIGNFLKSTRESRRLYGKVYSLIKKGKISQLSDEGIVAGVGMLASLYDAVVEHARELRNEFGRKVSDYIMDISSEYKIQVRGIRDYSLSLYNTAPTKGDSEKFHDKCRLLLLRFETIQETASASAKRCRRVSAEVSKIIDRLTYAVSS